MRQYKQQQHRRRRHSVAAWADTWRTEMKCAFPGHESYALLFLLMTAFSRFGIEPIRFSSADRKIDFHAFWRRCFNACSYWGSGSA